MNKEIGFSGFSPCLIICLITLIGCQKSPPNIVLINIDDMGWRDVGFMGSEYYSTPNIDVLAEGGMVFTSAYSSASNCAPSRASLMSGQWTPRHGIYTVGSSKRGKSRDRKLIPTENNTVLASETTTIAEVLRDAGYRTCHAGKWHISEDPGEQGFDVNIGGTSAGHPVSYYSPYGNVPLDTSGGEYLTDLVMKKAIEFVMDDREGPFFLYYAPYAVHTPICPVDSLLAGYEGKESWMGQGNPGYATMIENLDRNIGDLISSLESKKNTKNTLIVFTSDNGGHIRYTRQEPLRSGKGSYYEGGIRVPLLVSWKGKIKSHTSDAPVSHLDLFPTLIDVAGISPPDSLRLDGTSLIPHLRRNRPLPARPLFWHFPIYLQAYDFKNDNPRDSLFRTRPGSVVRVGDWKLHQYFEDGGIELYNLKEDIGEKHDMSEENPDKVKELLDLLEKWREATGAPVPGEQNPEWIRI